MILGIGVDTLNIKHFEKSVLKSPTIIDRVFTKNEQIHAPKNKTKRMAYFAKRFSAKEALSKACQTGIGKEITWQDIEISNTITGAPKLTVSPKVTKFICKKFKVKKFNFHLSLSDDENTLAFVILEK